MNSLQEKKENYAFNGYKPKVLTEEQYKLVQRKLKKYMLGIFICRTGGDILFSYQIDSTLKIDLISNFIAALSMFGKENVGQIKRIYIEGLNVEMNIVSKKSLITVFFFRPNMVKNHLEEEAEILLNRFYEVFKEPIELGKGNLGIYQKFEEELCISVLNYLRKLGLYKG
ncbi:hypothetical protein DSAG12_01132 [Promethearchaeum syntrophicum]|uniref:Uncharacterized protein n=1 Tax=Promethearchaeum syntrophicum TaxID=2594042 RepID=A0A5B9D8W8_9ARCH|nr:hypothetical protein [Candidatus Prometheoarchaeum syntrophicum]QEE15307.1 hypothetical protein DSAG12_01132 [Candidatus Prometheoarchaeum syntrophicum]